MEINKENNCVLQLVINHLSPVYLDDNIWLKLYTANDNEIDVN